MLSKNDKQYLIIGEIGQQKIISSNKDLNKKIESSLKELGLTKNDIILISSNNLKNISNLIQQSNLNISTNNNKEKMYKEKYSDLFNNSTKEDYYLFSINNRYEIYKQQFDNKFKSQIEQNTFISSKELFGGGIGLNNGGGNDIFLSGNKINININNNTNLQKQKIITHIKDTYTNFKTMTVNINSNFSLAHLLINENIDNIYKALSILNNYYKNQIQNIRINHETLKTYYEEVNSRVLSKEKEINNFFTIKMSLNNKKEIELFESLINEGKIKQLREKINNQINYLKDKIKNKSQKFDDVVNTNFDDTNNFSKKLKNVIDGKKLDELKNKLKLVESTFTELNKKYTRYKFENEIKQIQEINKININNSNFTFNSISNSNIFTSQDNNKININNNELDIYNNNIENDLNNLTKIVKNVKNSSEDTLFQIKNFITDSIIKKFFRFSSDIFITLDSFESYNKKFKSYINLLENIDKDNYDLLFYINEALKFKFYFNEYERRIKYLKDLKKTIIKLKKSLQKENEIRKKFNEELEDYFNGKLNDNKFGLHNNIISFFDWDDIKGNFDVYGDKYYNNIEIDEDELNYEINNNNNNNWRISLMVSDGNSNSKNDLNLEYYSQQEMIYHLNNKIVEYKSKIQDLEKDIDNKNMEFKELKFNFDQINNLLNSINKNNINKSGTLSSGKKINKNDINNNIDIKKSNTIFNPLYDEINEEDSFMNNNNNNNNNNISVSSSNEDILKNNKNNNNIINTDNYNNNIFLSLEQTYLIKKSFFNYFTNLLSIKNEEYNKLLSMYNTLQMSIEDKYSELLFLSSINKINLISINIGSINIFVGHTPGIYGCLLLNENANKKNNFTCEYYLDMDNLNDEVKNILNKEGNMIIIGIVKDIKKDKNQKIKNEDKYDNYENNIKKVDSKNNKKRYKKLVTLNKIIYLIYYQKDLYSNEILFKNYNVFN